MTEGKTGACWRGKTEWQLLQRWRSLPWELLIEAFSLLLFLVSKKLKLKHFLLTHEIDINRAEEYKSKPKYNGNFVYKNGDTLN